ncbi:MAG: hypothetical protein OXU72_11310, partial [Gammaproteobacteria bacterium]|nr:hypothetical protein [Gammaproteobacteria bacterium]
MPKSGIYSYRIRYYNKGLAGDWSISHTVTVSVPSMFTDGPAVETDTVPGTLAYDVGVTKGGQAYVNIPVQPVPGVNGLEPRLSIDYSSGRERQRVSDRLPGDVLGYGWRVSGLSAIRRCLKNRSSTTAIVFGIADGLCLDGEPLVRIVKEDDEESDAEDSSDERPADNPFAAGTEYRTYRESYAKIVVRQDTDSGDPWFEVFYPDGRRAEYGSTDDSRLRLADGGVIRTAPFLWSVKGVRDAYGNAMTHHYHEDETNGVRHPLKIVYGADGDAEVRFRYASRQDGGTVTMGGQTLTENVLLHTVEVRLGGGPVREYRLASETTDSGWRRLDKVQLCGYDERGSKSDCLTPMDFDWMAPQSAPAGYKTFVEGFSDPLGRATRFEYKTITETGVQFTEKPFGDPVAPDSDSAQVDGVAKPVVIAMVRGDGIDGKHRTEYAYYGKGFLSNYHWGFLGFYATRVTDTSSGVVTYFQYRLDAPHYARISAVHQYDGAYDPNDSALEILSKQLTLHEAQLFGKGAGKERHVPYVKQRTELLYEGGTGLGAKQTEQAMTFDSDGLLTRTVRTTKYGVGALETTRTPPTVWGGVPAYKFDKKTVHTSTSTVDLRNRTGSMSDVSQWLIGFTCREVLEESLTERTAEPLRRRWATYAAHGNTLDVASVTRLGASTGSDCPMETNDPTYPAISSLELTHTYGYDANGNLTSAGVNANATGHVAARSATATMFADKRYPQRLTNAEMHAESRTYDVRFGLPKSTTDPNGQTISRAYDPFGRVVRHTTRDGVAVNTRHLWCGTDLTCARVDNVDPVMAVETNSTIGPRTVTYLDSLGRRVRTETESFDGSTVDRQDIVYDDLGRVYRASVPYESSGSVAAKVHETEYDYDIRDRVEKLNRPDGGKVNTTRLACIDQVKEIAKETVYDEAGTEVAIRTRVSRYNLMGELVRVTEGGGTAAEDCNTPTGLTDAVTTDYIYNSSGQLKTVSVKAANSQTSKTVASFDYDAAGNRKQAIRPDTGQIDFTPTALGELHKRAHVKPSDLAVTYSYDKLGRITKAKDSSGSSHWVYDGATNGTGSLSRRCRMADASATGCTTAAVFDETYGYNGQARLRLTTTKI